ncbi:MAG: hypothetical protein ABF311_08980 [Polaribacter sp.]
MKLFIKNFTFAFIILLVSSCSKNQSVVEQDELNIDLSTIKLDLNKLKLNEPQVLFSYKNLEELKLQADSTIKELIEEIDDIVASNENITNVLFDLKFNKGVSTLDNVYFLDAKNREIINISENRDSQRIEFDWDSFLNGAPCPNGYTNNGSCSSASCISETTTTILTDGLEGNGDCSEIRYNRGLVSVRICSRSC